MHCATPPEHSRNLLHQWMQVLEMLITAKAPPQYPLADSNGLRHQNLLQQTHALCLPLVSNLADSLRVTHTLASLAQAHAGLVLQQHRARLAALQAKWAYKVAQSLVRELTAVTVNPLRLCLSN